MSQTIDNATTMSFTKKRAILGALAAILAIYLIGYAQLANNYDQRRAEQLKQDKIVLQDPALLTDARALGINIEGIVLGYSDNPKANDLAAGKAISIFIAPNIIEIKTGLSKETETNALDYEYMHYDWLNRSPEFRDRQGALYEKYLKNSPRLQQLMQPFHGTRLQLEDEMNSQLCTRIDPDQLSPAFNAYCSKVIPNRAILF